MTRASAMTPRRAEILSYLIEYHEEHGFVPSTHELMKRFGWSTTNAACEQLWKLHRDGYVERSGDRKARAMRILRRPDGCRYVQPTGDQQQVEALRELMPDKCCTFSGVELGAVPFGGK